MQPCIIQIIQHIKGLYSLPANSLKYFSLERDFSFIDCEMDSIACNSFQNIWPKFLEVVWVDFGVELPYEYLSCSFEWGESLEIKVEGQLKGTMGLDSLHSNPIG